jgi:hypothetical protein
VSGKRAGRYKSAERGGDGDAPGGARAARLPWATTHQTKVVYWPREAGVPDRYTIDEAIVAAALSTTFDTLAGWATLTGEQREFAATLSGWRRLNLARKCLRAMSSRKDE